MNITLTDIGNAVLNIAQQDFSKDAMFSSYEQGDYKPLFARELRKTLSSENANTAGLPDTAPEKVIPQGGAAVHSEMAGEKILEKLSDKKGVQFVTGLKNLFLLLSQGDLKNIAIDAQGLETLKKLLLKAGFDPSDVEKLVAELAEGLEEEGLTMDAVFDKLFDLEPAGDTGTDQTAALEMEKVPFLESLLVSFGIGQEQVQQILAEVQTTEEGIDLEALIEKLQGLEKKAAKSGRTYQLTRSDSNLNTAAEQLGLKLQKNGSSVVTFNELLGSLKQLKNKIVHQQQPEMDLAESVTRSSVTEKPMDLLNSLFKPLKLDQTGSENKTTGFFGQSSIKDQFDALAMGVMEEADEKTGLFNLKKDNLFLKGKNPDKVFKELESLLNGKSADHPAGKEMMTEDKPVPRKFMIQSNKGQDILQASAMDAKSGESSERAQAPKMPAPARQLPAYVTQQVGKSLIRAINQGENSLRIQLKPPELGRLLMTIDNTGNHMRVSIVTENQAAREIITQNITDLKSTLSNSGVNLEKFEVDMSSDFRQSMADARQQAGQSGKRGGGASGKTGKNTQTQNIDQLPGGTSLTDQDGSVHLVA